MAMPSAWRPFTGPRPHPVSRHCAPEALDRHDPARPGAVCAAGRHHCLVTAILP